MNKITVLAKNKETYFIKRLMEEVGEAVNLIDPWKEAHLAVQGDTILVRTTGVHGQGEDLAFLKQTGIGRKIINPLLALETFRSKKTQYQLLQTLGIPILPWLDLHTAGEEELQGFIKTSADQGPWLIKPHRGQGGWGIRLLDNQELWQWFRESPDREYLLQPFKVAEQELRLFFIQDWHLTLKREKASNMVAANFQMEGRAELVPNQEPLHKLLRQILSAIPCHYGAMDLLLHEGRPYVLELNSVPGIEQLEAVSGENIIRRLLTSMI